VFIESDGSIKPGDKIWCRVTDADEYDLWATPL
jgi:ribosomal protein S12 methylthiotransferase